jgi:NAD(P)-dependent dehydrogenase (short-subunit alcohol dehydrogenase family)
LGPNAKAIQNDASKMDQLDSLVEQIKGEKGRIDILFANAGAATPWLLASSSASVPQRFCRATTDCGHLQSHFMLWLVEIVDEKDISYE